MKEDVRLTLLLLFPYIFTMRVALVIGTRPQIIKSAPIIKEAVRRGLGLDVVHTGQHYDYEMSMVFFNELDLPDPAMSLGGWRSCL
jgi:UDP-N-acetylglucosamine 2-epimerase